MKISPEPQDSDRALRHLCELARATFTEELSAREQAGWSRLKVNVAERPRPRRYLALGFGLAVAAVALVPLALKWNQTQPSLGFRVVDISGVAQTAPDLASAGRIEFSDGSQVSVAAEARASVRAIDARGADGRLAEQSYTVRLVADARREEPEATFTELAERLGLHRSAVQRAVERIERLALHPDEGVGKRSASSGASR